MTAHYVVARFVHCANGVNGGHAAGENAGSDATFESGEIIKYATNSMLATRIAFINELADFCEKTGANIRDVAKGVGMDYRIGEKFLQPGPGYGGSCFPKDCRALVRTAQEVGAPLSIIETVVRVNDARKDGMAIGY